MLWYFRWPTSFLVRLLDVGYVAGAILLIATLGTVRKHRELTGPLVALSWLLFALVFSMRFGLVRTAFVGSLEPGGAEQLKLVACTRSVIHTLVVPMLLTIGVFLFLGVYGRATSKGAWGGYIVYVVVATLGLLMTTWVTWKLWPYAQFSGAALFP
jgi:hypothetical protein